MDPLRRRLLQSITALASTAGLSIATPCNSQRPTPSLLTSDSLDLAEMFNLFDFEKGAKAKMTKMAFEYVAGGAADELTLRWNRQAFDTLKLNPTVLQDVTKIDTRITLFGHHMACPILIAPTAFHRLMHPEGELATARGAGAAATTYVVSSFTTTPLEEIAKVAKGPLWFQLFIGDDRAFTKDLVQKAQALGYRALCITVDTPVSGVRNRQERVHFRLPPHLKTPYRLAVGPPQKPPTWQDIEWVKSLVTLPVMVKGILNPADAEAAVQAGVSGIIVSNHGGRNLDTVPATIEVLPAIARQVNQRIPILLDGGIRRGTDVLKAIALGSTAVLVGKPICYGLACGGAAGVTKVMDILKEELELAMALTGRATIASLDRSVLWES